VTAADRVTFEDTVIQPRTVITSAEWSGIESEDRRYAPFTINVERKKPWHTLTGRQHFFLDHEWIHEYGEALPTFRPPLNMPRHFGDQQRYADGRHAEVTVRYLTPHAKWSIHSEYQDNLHMLRLFRGGPVIWISPQDAEKIGVSDNDWIEAYNRNGVVACRAVVSHRMPPGTVYMYHAKDRHIMTPKSRSRAGAGAATTRSRGLQLKPDAHDRRTRAVQLRLQLHRAHGQPARRDHGPAAAAPDGGVVMRIRAQSAWS